MKTICYIYDILGGLKKSFTKCHNSTGHYNLRNVDKISPYQNPTWYFDNMCEDDTASYQGCGYNFFHSDTFTSYKNAICQLEITELGDEIIGRIVEGSSTIEEPIILPSGQTADRKWICNDKCEIPYSCEDEAQCNGFTYGQYCHLHGNSSKPIMYVRPSLICDPFHHKRKCCNSTEHVDSNFVECDKTAMCDESTPNCPPKRGSYPPRNGYYQVFTRNGQV